MTFQSFILPGFYSMGMVWLPDADRDVVIGSRQVLWTSCQGAGAGVCERAFLLECFSFHLMPCAVRPGSLFPSRQVHGTPGYRSTLPVRQQYKQTWEQGFDTLRLPVCLEEEMVLTHTVFQTHGLRNVQGVGNSWFFELAVGLRLHVGELSISRVLSSFLMGVCLERVVLRVVCAQRSHHVFGTTHGRRQKWRASSATDRGVS
eukprot:872262-Amphidinium_carterae.1